MFHDRKRSTCLSQWDEFIVLNIVQTLSLFLQSNYDRSWPSFLLIIIVDFYDQKASILLGYNQRNYITSRTNSQQHLLFFVRISCTAWKVSKYGVFFSVFSCIRSSKNSLSAHFSRSDELKQNCYISWIF